MLTVEYVIEDGCDRFIWSAFIEHFQVTRLRSEIIDAIVYGAYTSFVKFTLTRENRLGRGGEKNVVIQRGDEQLTPYIQKFGGQIDTRSATIAYDVGKIPVENDKSSDTCLCLQFGEIAQYVIN